MFVFTAMAETLGNDSLVWAVFGALGSVGLLLGRLSGGFRTMRPVHLAVGLLVIGALSSSLGARFMDAGIEVLVGLIAAGMMLIAFILGAAFAPYRYAPVPTPDKEPVQIGPWNPAGGYFDAADHDALRSECTNPVGRNLDIRA